MKCKALISKNSENIIFRILEQGCWRYDTGEVSNREEESHREDGEAFMEEKMKVQIKTQ